MKKLGDAAQVPLYKPPTRRSERGELMEYFAKKLSKPIGYVAYKLTGFKVPDMYYLKSICDQAEQRGEPWAKVWYGSIKNRP